MGKPGQQPARSTFSKTVDPPSKQVQTPSSIQGKVIDDQGLALAGVALKLRNENLHNGHPVHHITDSEGHFRISWEPHDRVTITFQAKGFQPKAIEFDGPQQNILVRLSPIHGQVQTFIIVDESDQPIDHAHIEISQGRTLEALQGEIILPNEEKLKEITVFADGFAPKVIRDLTGLNYPHTVRLSRSWSLHLRLLDGTSKQALTHFSLDWVIHRDGGTQQSEIEKIRLEETSSHENFFHQKIVGRRTLKRIFAPGYSPIALTVDQQRHLKTGLPTEYELFKKGTLYAGTLLSSKGKPIPNAKLHILFGRQTNWEEVRSTKRFLADKPISRKEPIWPFDATHRADGWFFFERIWDEHKLTDTDGQGFFSFDVPENDLEVDIFVDAFGHEPHLFHEIDQDPKVERHKMALRMPPSATMRLEVGQSESPISRSIQLTDSWNRVQTVILEQGEADFKFEGLASGEIRLELTEHDFSYQSLSAESEFHIPSIVEDSKTVTLEEDKEITVKLGMVDTITLSGRLYLDGEPRANETLSVFLPYQEKGRYGARTDANGHFSLDHLPPGIYEICLADPQLSDHRNFTNRRLIELIQDQKNIVLDFSSAGNIFGLVIDPPEEATLTLTYIQENPWEGLRQKANIQARDAYFKANPGSSTSYTYTEPLSAINTINRRLNSSGVFQFQKIPPGWIYLTLTSHMQTRTLVHSIVMPKHGHDLNLGDLQMAREGILQVNFQGSAPFVRQRFHMDFSGKHEAFKLPELRKITMMLSERYCTVRVPEGPIQVDLQPDEGSASGFAFETPQQAIIKAGTRTHIRVPVFPITYCSIVIPLSSLNKMPSVEIRNLLTGASQRLEIQNSFKLEEPLGFSLRSQYKGDSHRIHFLAHRVPPGSYRFDILSGEKRASVTKLIEPGQPIALTLQPGDFQEVNP